MPNYNISVVVDPSGAVSGVNVVESNLGKMESRAGAVKTAVQRAFDFNTGPAVAGASAVDKALDGVKTSAEQAGRATEGAMSRAGAAAARANGQIVNSQAQVRASTLQLGQQFNDFSTTVMSGGSVITAFAQQSGQAAFAMQGFNGKIGAVGAFLAGPWGTILTIATVVLSGFVMKLLEGNDSLEDAIKKLREDAAEKELNRRATEAFSRTTEGLRAAIRDLNEELGQQTRTAREAREQTLRDAEAQVVAARATRGRLQAELELRRELLAAQIQRATGPSQSSEMAALGLGRRQADIAAVEARMRQNQQDIGMAEQNVRMARIPLAQEDARQMADPIGRLNRQYDQMATSAINAARGNEQLSRSLTATLTAIERQRNAAIEAQREADRAARRTANGPEGVSTFRSREQAIGIAGQELQRGGLRVSENNQFGGVRGNHPGMGNAAHGAYAIDVNFGTGITEANVPDLRARFDELARRYQARGYEVVWNGQFYAAGGNGPTRPAAGHSDHLHIQAPRTVVGLPTQAANESAAIAEFNREQAEARRQAQIREAQGDFVTGVVDAAAARGQDGRVQTVEAQIERVFADYRRRFDEEMSPERQQQVRTALTEADARETANRFNDAYVKPLERLRELNGLTGLSREVLNAQLSESERLGRALTPVEAAQVENGIRQGDALERQAEILAEIRGPQEEYAARIAALNALLAQGTINQTSYNARVSELGEAARGLIEDMPGRDPNTGMSYGDIAARETENARYAQELDSFQTHREQLMAMGLNYDALIEAAHRRHVNNLNAIDQARRSMAIQSAMSVSDSLLAIARDSVGEQSAVYKGLFVISKAFAIADAIIKIQQGIANALALPFPANLGAAATVAAAAASIVSNIQAVALNFADGGYVRGPGSSRSDSVAANLSNGEFVVNAKATSENRALLEAINSGKSVRPVANDNVTVAGESYHIQVGDIHVQGGNGTPDEIGSSVKRAIIGIVREELDTQTRSGGKLTKTQGSIMTG